MNFDAKKTTIKDLLSVGRKYYIPRYQREYSWEKKELEEFYSDIIANISMKNSEFKLDEYFFGTIMLIGDMTNPEEKLEVVDGQQRLTTFTIFLSTLSNICDRLDSKISEILWSYVIGKDDNGKEYVILENETASPYFQYKIQKRLIDQRNFKIAAEYEVNGLTPEEKRIKEAYDFFMDKLKEETIRKNLNVKEKNISYIELIKVIRDQVLRSQILYISSKDADSVNKIFENINARGKQLTSIDLIKNEIFSTEKNRIPIDDAKEIWKSIKNNLNKDKQGVSLDVFIRHFWLAIYGPTTEKELYNKFLKRIKPEEYSNFLEKLKVSSKNYFSMIKPNESLFTKSNKNNGINKWDCKQLIYSLNILNELNISQVRIILLALYEVYLTKKINYKNFKETVKFLEEFHYIYNGVCKLKTNILESMYSKFSRKIISEEKNSIVIKHIDDLKRELKKLKPDTKIFNIGFYDLTFYKNFSNEREKQKNIIAKYTIRKIEEILCSKGIYDSDQVSIEHIIAENTKENFVGDIGNLVLLESILNEEASNLLLKDKIKIYKKSKYKSVEDFIKKFSQNGKINFSENEIEKRKKEMAEIIYQNIMK